jgi:hypothetical protein
MGMNVGNGWLPLVKILVALGIYWAVARFIGNLTAAVTTWLAGSAWAISNFSPVMYQGVAGYVNLVTNAALLAIPVAVASGLYFIYGAMEGTGD